MGPLVSLIQQALDCVAGAVAPGTRLIVFGSQARANARPDSDIDLLVVELKVTDRFAKMAGLSTLLGRRLIPANVVVMSAAAFEQQKTLTNTVAWRAASKGSAMNSLFEHARAVLARARAEIAAALQRHPIVGRP